MKSGTTIDLVETTFTKSCWKVFGNSENLNVADNGLLTLNVTTLLHIVHLLQSFQTIIIIIIISVTNIHLFEIIF